MSTPAPMYTPYRAEGSQLDSSSNTTFPSPPVPELPSPPPPSNLYESITPFAPNDIYPTLGSCSNGLGVSLSTAPIPPAELHSPDVRSACPGPEGRAPSYTR